MKTEDLRYEFRCFAQGFGLAEERLRSLASVRRFAEERDTYLVSPRCDDAIVELRGGGLDVKQFRGRVDGLELWAPGGRQSWTLSSGSVARVRALLRLPGGPAASPADCPDGGSLIEHLRGTAASLQATQVVKRRLHLDIADCLGEVTEVFVNGVRLASICVESVDSAAVKALIVQTGLNQHANVNYLLAVKRVLGLKPLAPESFYRTHEAETGDE